MEIILIAVAAVILVASIGLLLLKNKQKAIDNTPVAAPVIDRTADRTQAPDVSPDTLSSGAALQTPDVAINPLDKAESLINDQRYDDATHELKRLLMSNLSNSNAMLKLLQVYGITNNHNAFNQLHQKIHELGDPDIIKQADFCRSLLEDDLTPSVSAPSPAPKEAIQINSLDFDIEDTHQSAVSLTDTPEQSSPNLEESFNLEESLDLEESFDLTFDEPIEPNAHSADTPALEPITSLESHTEEDVGFDFDFDTSSESKGDALTLDDTPSASAAKTQDLTDDFSLDFEESTLTPSEDARTASDESAEFELGDFDFDLSEPSQSASEPQTSSDSLSDDNLFDLDDSFELDSTSSTLQESTLIQDSLSDDITTDNDNALSNDVLVHDTLTDDGLALDGFDFDLSTDTASSSNDLSSTATDFAVEAAQDDFVFDDTDNTLVTDDSALNTDASATQELIADSAPADTSISMDEFAFDLDDSLSADLSQANISQDDVQAASVQSDFESALDFEQTIEVEQNNLGLDSTFEQNFASDEMLIADDSVADVVETDVATTDISATESLAVSEPTKDELAFTFDEKAFDDDLSFAQPKSVDIDSAPAAVSAPVSNLADDLSFVATNDSAQVTLELATRYLNLGEQDSARRLLEEVLHSGNPAQQKSASDLLARL